MSFSDFDVIEYDYGFFLFCLFSIFVLLCLFINYWETKTKKVCIYRSKMFGDVYLVKFMNDRPCDKLNDPMGCIVNRGRHTSYPKSQLNSRGTKLFEASLP